MILQRSLEEWAGSLPERESKERLHREDHRHGRESRRHLQRAGWEEEDVVPVPVPACRASVPSKAALGSFSRGPSGTYHSDRQSDQVSPAPDLEWEEPGALWKHGPLYYDHLIILALVALALVLLGAQAGSEILEALVHFPGVQIGLWVSWGQPPSQIVLPHPIQSPMPLIPQFLECPSMLSAFCSWWRWGQR